MNTRRMCVLMIGVGLIATVGFVAAQQPPPIKPTSPATVGAPAWSRALPMPDGRTFVTDGGLSVDVKLAKPASMPSVVLPPESGKNIAARMSAPHEKEVRLDELRPGKYPNSFATPDGVALNGNYIRFLREILPRGSRLRTRGVGNAITIVADGEPVGIMMPLSQPR